MEYDAFILGAQVPKSIRKGYVRLLGPVDRLHAELAKWPYFLAQEKLSTASNSS